MSLGENIELPVPSCTKGSALIVGDNDLTDLDDIHKGFMTIYPGMFSFQLYFMCRFVLK